MNLNNIKIPRVAFQLAGAAAERDLTKVQAKSAERPEVQPAPVSGTWNILAGATIIVVVRIERATRAEGIIQPRGQDDLLSVKAFGNQLTAELGFDARP
ncbi:MAG: hypothetical protein ABI619_07575, partial [Betaproteobacteria bacterium]